MALPASKSPEELAKLDDKRLLEYFIRHARYLDDIPLQCYAIRLGTVSIYDNDTAALRDKFFNAVRGVIKTTKVEKVKKS